MQVKSRILVSAALASALFWLPGMVNQVPAAEGQTWGEAVTFLDWTEKGLRDTGQIHFTSDRWISGDEPETPTVAAKPTFGSFDDYRRRLTTVPFARPGWGRYHALYDHSSGDRSVFCSSSRPFWMTHSQRPSWPTHTAPRTDDLTLLAPAEASPAAEEESPPSLYSPARSSDTPTVFTSGELPDRRETAFRLGWWAVDTQGDLTKVGEFQDLNPSTFWDFERLASDGTQTLELYGTGLDREGIQAGLGYFEPRYSIDVDFQRYLRRLDHDPLSNFAAPNSGEELVSEDLNVGEDYAIRVEELRTYIKGNVTKNIKYRVNFRLLRKHGERQALGTQHGGEFETSCNSCHVLSQRQRIDWLTFKAEPVIEAKLGRATVEYSRPMRVFDQADQVVTRSYGDFHVYDFGGVFPYAVVPDSFTQTDRLKLGVDLTDTTRFYGRVHTGDTHNATRDTHRRFHGFDLRLTDRTMDHLTLTGFARMRRQTSQFPPFLVDPEGNATSDTTTTGDPLFTSIVPPYGLRRPINYLRNSAGAEANWRPLNWSELAKGFAVNGGGEWGSIRRGFAEYVTTQDPPAVFDQAQTSYTSYFLGASMRWTPPFDTFVRYKGRVTSDPLFGVDMHSGETNTSLPEHQSLVEVGGTWVPAENLVASLTIGVEDRRNSSDVADFREQNYPLTITVWYAPTPQWSLSAGYGRFTNWIDQQILFPSDDPAVETWDTRRWSYRGIGRVLNLGASYAWTEHVTLTGGLEYVWARDAVDPLAPWPDLPEHFDVAVAKTRLSTGVDWWLRDGISAYFRYLFEDYEDTSVDYNSGTAHMFLGGATVVY